jgi:hypothetical protein
LSSELADAAIEGQERFQKLGLVRQRFLEVARLALKAPCPKFL